MAEKRTKSLNLKTPLSRRSALKGVAGAAAAGIVARSFPMPAIAQETT